jgi:hypothetical protein
VTPRAHLAGCCLALLLGAGARAEAALQVVTQGPRSGAVGVQLRQAFADAGITRGRVVVQVRRGHPSWSVSVSVYRPGVRQPALVVGLRARAGHVASEALARIAKRAAPLLARGRGEPAPKPEPPKPDAPPPDAPPPEPQPEPEPEAKPEPPPAPKAPTPKVEPPSKPAGTEKEIDFDTDDEPAARRSKPAARKPARARPEPDADDEKPARRRDAPVVRVERVADPVTPIDRVVARINAGVGLAHRRFVLDWVAAGVDYETGVYSQLFVQGEVYPFQLLTANPIARLGVRLGYETSAGLSTEEQPGNPLTASLTTTVRRFWAGLSFLFPPFRNKVAPRFDLRFGLHHTDFEIDANAKVQDLSLTTLAPGGGLTWPFRSFLNLALSAEYRALIRARNDVVERYAPGTAALQGVWLEAAVLGKIFAGLGYRVSFCYERLAGDVADPAGGEALIVRDRYLAGDLALSYEF